MLHILPNGSKMVEVEHPWTHQKIHLPIESIDQKYISVRWGQSGTYDIELKEGTMRARSAKARRKGFCIWKVVDVRSLRKFVFNHFYPDAEAEAQKRFEAHLTSMPFPDRKGSK